MSDLPITKTENYQSITANNSGYSVGIWVPLLLLGYTVEYSTGMALLGWVSGELTVIANHLHSTVWWGNYDRASFKVEKKHSPAFFL